MVAHATVSPNTGEPRGIRCGTLPNKQTGNTLLEHSTYRCGEMVAHTTISPNTGWTSVLDEERFQTNKQVTLYSNTVHTAVGEWLHTLPPRPALGELRGIR